MTYINIQTLIEVIRNNFALHSLMVHRLETPEGQR